MTAALQVRALALADLPALLAVQQACYGAELVEGAEVFARRLASPANCSLVLERAGCVCAYLAAYRTLRGKLTPLHGDFDSVTAPDTLYLHDMAVLPNWAGQGLAAHLLHAAWQAAAAGGAWQSAAAGGALQHTALVAVQGAQAYWARYGYQAAALTDATQRAHLRAYGDGAVYMERGLPAPLAG